MIQRIQSIYLLLSALAITAMYFLPLALIPGSSEEFYLNAGGIGSAENAENLPLIHINFLPLFGMMLLEIIFTLIIIFQYKKRNRQMMLGKANLLILTALIAAVFFYADYAKTFAGLPKETIVNYQFACLLPVLSIILNYLAIRAIKKDEDLVRAADRLR